MIGHFWVAPSLCFKARLGAKPLMWKWFFILMQKKTFSRKVLHLASFWKWEFLELGNGSYACYWLSKVQSNLYILSSPPLSGHLPNSWGWPGARKMVGNHQAWGRSISSNHQGCPTDLDRACFRIECGKGGTLMTSAGLVPKGGGNPRTIPSGTREEFQPWRCYR